MPSPIQYLLQRGLFVTFSAALFIIAHDKKFINLDLETIQKNITTSIQDMQFLQTRPIGIIATNYDDSNSDKIDSNTSQLPTTQIMNQREYQLLHSTNQDVLDLLDWERDSLDMTALCNPPEGIPKSCCIGSHSSGGGVSHKMRYKCKQMADRWDDLQGAVYEFYHRHQLHHLLSSENGRQSALPCDVCQLIEQLRIHSLNLTWIGDSMQSQIWEGFCCELLRRNYHVELVSRVEYNSTRQYIYRTFGGVTHFSIRSPLWPEHFKSVSTTFYRLYKLPVADPSNDEMDCALDEADFLVLGFGLHWYHNTKEQYVDDMTNFLEKAKQHNISLVVHRETSAQHFDAPGGAWEYFVNDRVQQNRSKSCQPLNSRTRYHESIYWRERAIQEASQNAGYRYQVGTAISLHHRASSAGENTTSSNQHHPALVALPYHNFTIRFHSLHPDNGAGADFDDCTHYCGSPFMYMTLWRPLRMAFDAYFGSTSSSRRRRR